MQNELGIDLLDKGSRERFLVKKVSKVSILQTARKIENDRVLTEQRLIPLTQQTKVKISDAQLANPSSQFASRVPKNSNLELDATPGPGTYQAENDQSRQTLMQATVLEKGAKRVGFGSQAERRTDLSLV